MENKYTPTYVGQLLKKHGFRMTKSLGQNFLIDGNIIENIVLASGASEKDLVIEVGPGIGALTYPLSQVAKKVIAIEIDEKAIPLLQENIGICDNVEIINKDFLKIDLLSLVEGEREKGTYENIVFVGNLPYYITTPIIMKILESRVQAKSLTIMVQKEVGERIIGKPSTKAYGSLSIAIGYYCDVTLVTQVSKEVFMPKPNVDSIVIRLDINQEPAIKVKDELLFFKVVKGGFAQRRKTLLNSLGTLGLMEKAELEILLQEVGIDPKRRGETLTIEEYGELSDALSERI